MNPIVQKQITKVKKHLHAAIKQMELARLAASSTGEFADNLHATVLAGENMVRETRRYVELIVSKEIT